MARFPSADTWDGSPVWVLYRGSTRSPGGSGLVAHFTVLILN